MSDVKVVQGSIRPDMFRIKITENTLLFVLFVSFSGQSRLFCLKAVRV